MGSAVEPNLNYCGCWS